MAQKGSVDLIIRAKNDATKALDSISSSLKNLKDQQTIVGNSATQTNGQLSALSLELQRLRTNAQNMQQLANIAGVMDKATTALKGEKQAAADAAAETARLTSEQQKLAAKQATVTDSLRTATAELDRQKNSANTTRAAVSDLSKQSTALSTEQRNTQRSLEAVTKRIQQQQTSLAEAATKHATLAAAVAQTDAPTKRLTASLEAAERTLKRRGAALDESRAKEAALQATLAQNADAQSKLAIRIDATSKTLKANQNELTRAADRVKSLTTESRSLASSQSGLDQELVKAKAHLDAMKASVDAAENEYKQLKAAADAAKAAVGQSASSTTAAGAAAAAAAAQLAIYAARAKALQSGSGRTTSPLNINVADINASNAAMRNAQAVVAATQRSYSAAAVSVTSLQNAIATLASHASKLSALSTAVANQKTAVDGAYTSWKAAEAEVKRLAIAIKAAGGPSDALAAAFGNAQGQAKLAKNEFLNQKAAADQLAQSLQRAGQGTGTLASAEASLQASLRNTNSAAAQAAESLNRMQNAGSNAGGSSSRLSGLMANLRGALANVSSTASQAAAGFQKIAQGARSAAGPVGGLTSELGGLAAQVASVYALKQGFDNLLEVNTGFDAMGAKLRVAFGGDMKAANDAMEFSLKVAKDLKLPLLETTKGYADMAIAAKGTSLEGKGVNDIFVAFAQSARVTRTSSADLNGVFKALTQSISKGKVQAEELRGQLGDRLPGAINMMAAALGVTTGELDKMMVNGELTIDTLHRMAAEVSSRVAPELDKALDSPAAKIQDFKNKWTELLLTLGQSGFLDAIGNAADKLGAVLVKPETIEFVNQLGQKLADLVDWLVQAEDPFEKFRTVLEVIIGLKAVGWIAGVVTGVANLVSGVKLLAGAFTGLSISMTPVLIAVAALAAVFAVAWLANWANDNVPWFAKLVLQLKGVCLEVWSAIKEGWDVAGASIENAFSGVFARLKGVLAAFVISVVDSVGGLLEKLGMAEGLQAIKAKAEGWAKAAEDTIKGNEAEIAAIQKKGAEERAAIQAQIAQQIQDKLTQIQRNGEAERAKTAVVPETPGNSTAKSPALSQVTGPDGDYEKDTTKADEKAAKKRLALEQKVADQIAAIQSTLNRNRANDLDTQITGIKQKYAGLFEDLKTLGKGADSKEFKDALAAQNQEIQLARDSVAKKDAAAGQKRVKQEESVAKEIAAIQSQLNRKSSEELDTQIEGIGQKYQALYDKLTALGKGQNSEEWKTVDALKAQEIQQAKNANAKKVAREGTRAEREAEQNINDLLSLRRDLLEQIKYAESKGDYTTAEKLKEQYNGVNAQLRSAIDAQIAYWEAAGGPKADLAIAKLKAQKDALENVKSTGILTYENLGKLLGSDLKSASDGFVDKIKETGDVFGSLKESFQEFLSSFLAGIAKMILQQLLFNAISSAAKSAGSGAFGSILGAAASAVAGAHTGGIAGSGTLNKRTVNPGIFSGAARYHTGGVVGLQPWEVPIVAKKGEEVLTESDPRHIKNAGQGDSTGGGNGAGSMPNFQIINAIDPDEVVQRGLSSSAGTKTLINFVRLNRSTVKQILG